MRRTKFQATPLFVEDSLIFCSPFNEVIGLDPGTGAQRWRYDPKIATNQRPANRYVCRGVTYWIDGEAPANAACRSRIFMGTNDVRLITLDAKMGIPCAGFGNGGEVRLDIGMALEWPGEFQITSPPAVGRSSWRTILCGSFCGRNRDRRARDRKPALAPPSSYHAVMIVLCMRCERAFTSRALLHEGEADALVAAPNCATMPYEIVARDRERE